MTSTALPELASIMMMLSVFALMFVAANVVARGRGHRD